MASWTDNPNIQYTPYIETNPTDAYLRVGMYKEQQLAAGIQKVQQQIDTLTGLPIIKEEDKKYLQEKLSSLKTGITKNLSGDFSDSRIVNQIAGAAKSIYSDPVVQNSVQGTMSYQKGLADIEQAKKDGKWNIANETVFQDGVNSWLSDKTVGSKASQYFSGYTPYTDVNEMFLKYWKETNPTEDMSNAYYTDSNGKTAINPVIFKGKNAGQIQAVWNLVKGNANVQQQLGIDGKYQFRGQSPEQIYTQLGEQTKASIDENNAAILTLQAKAAVGDTGAAKDIEQLKKLNIESEKALSSYAEALKTNPDAVKGAIASQRTLSSLIGAYTYQTMEKSPLWETSFQENKFRIETEQWSRTFDQNERKFDWQKQMDQLNYSLAVDKQKQDKKTALGIINPAAVNPDEVVKDENTARAAVAATQEEYTQAAREAAYNMALRGGGAAMYVKDPATGKFEYNVGEGKPYGSKEEVDAVTKYYLGQLKDGAINGTIDGPVAAWAENMETKYRNLQAAQKRVSDTEALFAPQTAQIAQTLKEETKGDTQLAQDFVRAYTVNNKLPGWEATEAGLKQKYGPEWRSGMGIYVGQASENTNTGGFVAPDLKASKNGIAYIKAAEKLSKNTSLANLVQAKDLAYKKSQSVPVGYEVTLNTTDGATKLEARNIYAGILSGPASLNPDSNKGDIKEMQKLLADKGVEDNVYSHYLDPTTQQGYISIGRGAEKVTVKVPASVILQNWSETSTYSAFREKYQTSLDLNNGISTDRGGNEGGFATAFRAPQPPASPYVVKYHINNTGNGYNVKWWVAKNPGGGKPVGEFYINGEIVGEKYGVPSNMSEEQVEAITSQMKDKSWVERNVELKRKLDEQNK